MNVPNRVFETMTRGHIADFTVRVWRNCGNTFRMGPDREIQAIMKEMDDSFIGNRNGIVHQIVSQISCLMDVEAIEILDSDGNGGLFYPDWK